MRIMMCAASALAVVSTGSGAVVPFTETFATGNSFWRDAAGAAGAAWVASGGPDGSGYITGQTNVNAAAFGSVIALRGQAGFGSSGGAFSGNWISEGIALFSFDVRHDAPTPVNFGVRFASSANFPGASAVSFVPVLPNTWTTIQIAINAANPQFVSFEGTDFNAVFSSIGNVQLSYAVPEALAGSGTVIQVEADNVSIVPGPGGLMLGAAAMAGLAWRRRRSGV